MTAYQTTSGVWLRFGLWDATRQTVAPARDVGHVIELGDQEPWMTRVGHYSNTPRVPFPLRASTPSSEWLAWHQAYRTIAFTIEPPPVGRTAETVADLQRFVHVAAASIAPIPVLVEQIGEYPPQVWRIADWNMRQAGNPVFRAGNPVFRGDRVMVDVMVTWGMGRTEVQATVTPMFGAPTTTCPQCHGSGTWLEVLTPITPLLVDAPLADMSPISPVEYRAVPCPMCLGRGRVAWS